MALNLLLSSSSPGLLQQTATSLGALNHRNWLSPGSGSKKPEIKVSAGVFLLKALRENASGAPVAAGGPQPSLAYPGLRGLLPPSAPRSPPALMQLCATLLPRYLIRTLVIGLTRNPVRFQLQILNLTIPTKTLFPIRFPFAGAGG